LRETGSNLSGYAGRTADRKTMAAVSPLGRASGVERREAPADALTGLYERHASRVLQYCLNWLRSREEAEDAAQTTFLYAYRALDRGVVPTHERPWLLSIARNVCLTRTDAARRRAVEVAQDPHVLEETAAAAPLSNELHELTDALATLTEQQRHAILLREWHGLAYSEIAERLDLSQAAVETLLFRARRSLARRLRQPLGLGSFLPWLRSLAEGGAAKVAVGVATVAVTATTGAVTLTHRHHPRPAAQTPVAHTTPPLHSAPVVHKVSHAARKVVFAKHHTAPAKATPSPVTTPYTDEPAQEPAAAPAQPRTEVPAVSVPTAGEPAVVPVQTTATTDATAPVVDTVTTAATTVPNTVTDVVNNATATVVTTAQNAITAVTNVVPVLTKPLLP
jgi:RNA polymerase sigma-70 factor (ECF subfamily)